MATVQIENNYHEISDQIVSDLVTNRKRINQILEKISDKHEVSSNSEQTKKLADELKQFRENEKILFGQLHSLNEKQSEYSEFVIKIEN